jgi:hypothetical protein
MALLVTGCSVDLNGAPCAVAGETADCPDRQACGNDLRCSARALACVATRCAPGATECIDGRANARRCDRAADPVCGRWVADGCAARDPACRIVADPGVLSPNRSAPPPTGIPQPPECRFGRLGDALAAAAERAPAAATAWIEGEAGVAAAFGAVTGEEWPLVVATNVTVVAASPQPAPIIRGEAEVLTIVAVHGVLEDVRVEGGGATGVGVALSCGASGTPELRRVEVDGGGVLLDPDGLVTAGLSAGVTVAGTCGGARLSGVQVSAVAGPALSIDPAAAATVDVLGGSFGGSNVGIWIRGGKVKVAPDPDGAVTTLVFANSADGLVVGDLSATATPVDVVLERISAASNGGTGIVFAGLPPASSLVRMTACDVWGNGAVRAAKYGPQSARRTAGGVLVALGQLPFTFIGNRVWANAGDQLAFESDATWSIAAPSCGPDTNVFACVAGPTCADGGACAVALSGLGSVHAAFNTWPTNPAYQYVTSNIADFYPEYCTTESGVPAKPTCPQ